MKQSEWSNGLKKIILILLTLLVTMSVGCENVEYIEKSQSPEESVGIYEKLESELPQLNDGASAVEERAFKIVTDKKAVFSDDESNPASINKAIKDRNAFLRSKYGATLEITEVASSNVSGELKAAIESGLDYCDMLAISGRETVKLYTSDLLGDMNQLPGFDLNSSIFNRKHAKELATNNTLYMLADPTAIVYEEAYVYFYNRDLVTDIGGIDPETLVIKGKWTWDAFNEAARASAAAVYEKTSADLNNDVFGFGAYYLEGTYPLVMWSSSGEKLIKDTYKNPVGLSMEMNDITTVAEYMMSSYNSRGKYPMDGNSAETAFKDGRLAFFCNKFAYFYALRDGTTKGDNFGMLPIPKYSESQEGYSCLLSSDARVFAIPKTVESYDSERKEFVSAVIQGTVASGNSTIPQAFENHHIGFYLNNNNEAVVLGEILDGITYDFANVYGSGISSIRLATTAAIVDYLDIGSGLVNSINYAKAGFENYCNEKFNK